MKDKFRTLDDPDPPKLEITPEQVVEASALVDRITTEQWERLQKERQMPVTLSLIFLVLAAICFLLAAFNATISSRVNPTALGLFFWVVGLVLRPFVP